MAIDVGKLSITQIDSITCFNNANELEFIMDEIQEGNINNTQEKVDVTGKNGRKILSLKKNKAVIVTATNGFVVAGALSAQTGSDIENGSFKVRKTEIVAVTSNSATLSGTPVGTAGAEIGFAYKKNANGTLGTKYEQDATASSTGKFAFSDGTLTFFADDVQDGQEVVVFYDEEVEAAKISNDSETYSKVLKMYIDVTVQDNCDKLYHGQFIIPRADFSGEFDLSMGGDPTVHNIEAESLAGGCSNSTALWDFIIFE